VRTLGETKSVNDPVELKEYKSISTNSQDPSGNVTEKEIISPKKQRQVRSILGLNRLELYDNITFVDIAILLLSQRTSHSDLIKISTGV